ncbi:glycosyltransferase [Gordonibacter urolithinfaciens]|uniref:glycosyltransferase n=1 Tax=Gordonibacter urolithinfaciens TaxID=1335613 RepID=UPI003AAB5CBC
MRVLVLATAYPKPNGECPLMFVHTRNLEYVKLGLDVTVINFACASEYRIDGINVKTAASLDDQYVGDFDLVICHAPNIRQHYRFCIRFNSSIKKLVFFAHGHEFLQVNKYYPEAFPFVTRDRAKDAVRPVYDKVKLALWRHYFRTHSGKVTLVFVSNWMKDAFWENVLAKYNGSKIASEVIPNSVGRVFLDEAWNANSVKDFDFITIRSSFDSKKYCVDLVAEAARENPTLTFLLIGRGEYFEHYEKPDNLIIVNRTMDHAELLSYVDRSRCALMPTRQDTQGVMSCELATYGIPLVTSDISICREVLSKFNSVAFVSNACLAKELPTVFDGLKKTPTQKNREYSVENTVHIEIALFERMIENRIG